MMRLRVLCSPRDTATVVGLLDAEPGVAHLVVAEGASRQPMGHVVEAEVARQVAEDVLQRLNEHGMSQRGEITLQTIDTIVSRSADAAERDAPGQSADAVVWEELLSDTGEESELNPAFLAFLTIACLLAAVGVVTGSTITIVGAMVVSPDFGPLAGLAVAVVGRRRDLAARAALSLTVGFGFAMLVTAALALLAWAAGLYDPASLAVTQGVQFIHHVGPYSAIVALLAGAAGMLSLTAEKSGALIGVFISVTTVPAAGFAVLAAIAGDWHQCAGAVLQLLINLVGIVVAGTLTLQLRRRHIVPGARTPTRRPGGGVRRRVL